MSGSYLFAFVVTALVSDIHCLKNVVLTLEPAVVERSHNCILRCTYDLEGMPMYTVKWYHGHSEFYRYKPYETPSTKVFPTPSRMHVDEDQSNSTQVVLQDVEFHLSGKFICEVTTHTANQFSTGHDIKVMQVVQLPADPPEINVSTKPLYYGDLLTANCTSPNSKPPAQLKFLLNNRTVARTDSVLVVKSQELSRSELFLNITLTEDHFSAGQRTLRCEAYIPDIYYKSTDLKLISVTDPFLEVNAADSAYYVSSTVAINLIIMNFLHCRFVSILL